MNTSDQLFDVSGKVVCVTGASSGICRHTATMLANRGAKVVGVARRADQLEAWENETDGQTASLAFDLSDKCRMGELAQLVSKPFGAPDILINGAGINTRTSADEVTEEIWDLTQSVNLAAPFFLSQKLVPAMKAKGWGRIINFASLQSFRAFPNGISYGSAKGAVAQMTRAMSEAWSKDGINTNAIGPGFFKTELTAKVFDDPERANRNAEQTCIGRNGEMADLDGPVLFLSSDASAYITGQILMVDGGFTAK
ncbi:SDR family oxidoreductase [Lentilitoribacter sp. Alg239-R112]|uniref:SDR family NAD(P)-dependent oxidoreductase n=1 Tax=Lentilitoribacter sp. Alg239-R112 TaxID=2305987 RepID=UPI0013A70B21|nr:SDR family oxidoreductase [Lentilitoribacter sp. Alg239-R112]